MNNINSTGNFLNDLDLAIQLSQIESQNSDSYSKDLEKALQLSKAEAEAASIELPSLTDKQREATQGKDPQYSLWFASRAEGYHQLGDTWTDEDLQNMFIQGLLRFYIHEVTGYRFDYEYDRHEGRLGHEIYAMTKMTNFSFLEKTFSIVKELSRQEMVDYARVLKRLIQRFCDAHPDLIRLGGLFQKKKIELEKLSSFMEKNAGQNDELVKKALQLDKEIEVMQQIIYHWIVDGMQKLKDFMKDKTPQIVVDQFLPSSPQFFKSKKYSLEPFQINKLPVVKKVALDDLLTAKPEGQEILDATSWPQLFSLRFRFGTLGFPSEHAEGALLALMAKKGHSLLIQGNRNFLVEIREATESDPHIMANFCKRLHSQLTDAAEHMSQGSSSKA